jgi:hypothetical protein
MSKVARPVTWPAVENPVIRDAAEGNAFMQIIDEVVMGEIASTQFVAVIRARGACIPVGKRAAVSLPGHELVDEGPWSSPRSGRTYPLWCSHSQL